MQSNQSLVCVFNECVIVNLSWVCLYLSLFYNGVFIFVRVCITIFFFVQNLMQLLAVCTKCPFFYCYCLVILKREHYPEPKHKFMILYTFPPPEVEVPNDYVSCCSAKPVNTVAMVWLCLRLITGIPICCGIVIPYA